MKTIFFKEDETPREWLLVDAANRPLGRVAAEVASLVRGKHKAHFVRNQEMGDFVVVINADKVVMTGTKEKDKMYYHHTGFPGGIRSINFAKLQAKKPGYPLKLAVKGMLPKGSLGRKLLKNVKIYAGDTHPHAAQNPTLYKAQGGV